MKSTLRSSVCGWDGGWYSTPPSHILALSLGQKGAYTLPSSPGPQSGSRTAQGRSWRCQVPIPQHSASLKPVRASFGLSYALHLLQEDFPDCCHPWDFTTQPLHVFSSRQHHCHFMPGEILHCTCHITGFYFSLLLCFLIM